LYCAWIAASSVLVAPTAVSRAANGIPGPLLPVHGRRERAKQRGHNDEFMDMDVEVDPDWATPAVASTAASDRGGGTLGFAGTVSKDGAQPTGLAALSGDEFGGGPRMPMLPNTWDPEAPEGPREDR